LRRPRIGVLGAAFSGRSCVRASFRFVVRTRGALLRSVRVTLDGRTIARSTSHRFTVTVPVRTSSRGGHVIRITVVAGGGTRTRTLRYVRCGPPPKPSFTG
jgi:hypothetical protein